MHNKPQESQELDPTANLRALVLKTNLEKPDKRDVQAPRKLLHDNPRLWKQVGDPARKALSIRLQNSPLSIPCESLIRVRNATMLIPGGLFQAGLEQDLSLNSGSGESALLAARSGSPESDWSLHFQKDSAIE
jgi:hypothetical protein